MQTLVHQRCNKKTYISMRVGLLILAHIYFGGEREILSAQIFDIVLLQILKICSEH